MSLQQATNWLLGQQSAIERITGSVITPEQNYDSFYTGYLRGTFDTFTTQSVVQASPILYHRARFQTGSLITVTSPIPIPTRGPLPSPAGDVYRVWMAGIGESGDISWIDRNGTPRSTTEGITSVDGDLYFCVENGSSITETPAADLATELQEGVCGQNHTSLTDVKNNPADPVISFTGPIQGQINGVGTISSGQYTVEAYIFVIGDAEYLQGSGAVNTDGTFEITSVFSNQGDEWRLKLYNNFTSQYVGDTWTEGATPFSETILTGSFPVQWSGSIEGIIYGSEVNLTGSYAVSASIVTDTAYFQTASLVNSSGSWSLSLPNDTPSPDGYWQIVLIDTSTNTQVGGTWIYENNGQNRVAGFTVDYEVTTDITYPIATVSASFNTPSGGTFEFFAPQAGGHTILLKSGSTTIGRWRSTNGLLRSYNLEPSDDAYNTDFENRCFSYDQGVAMIGLVAQGELESAARIATGMSRLIQTSSAWAFSYSQFAGRPESSDPQYRTGANAWVNEGLQTVLKAYPHHPSASLWEQAIRNNLEYLLSLKNPVTGLLKGGSGRYVNDVFDPDWQFPNHSVEHNVDSWFALQSAAQLLGEVGLAQSASVLYNGLTNFCWNPTGGHFYTGCTLSGSADGESALDVHSWGGILLHANNDMNKALSSVARMDVVYSVTSSLGNKGYKPYSAIDGYGLAVDTCWWEGSWGAALAKKRILGNRAYEGVKNNLLDGQLGNGGFLYVDVDDVNYGLSSYESVASTGWYLITENDQILWTKIGRGTPRFSYGEGFTSSVYVPYVRNPIFSTVPRESSQFEQTLSGYEDSWVTGMDGMVQMTVEGVGTTSSYQKSSWNQWQEFLDWASVGNPIRLHLDSNNIEFFEGYLIEKDVVPTVDAGGYRSFTITFRTPYGSPRHPKKYT